MSQTPPTAVFTLRDLNRQPAKVLGAVRKFGSAEVRTRGGEVFTLAVKADATNEPRAISVSNFAARWKRLRQSGHVPPAQSDMEGIDRMIAGEP